MREIKFRAWHRSLEKMSYSDSYEDAEFWNAKVGDGVFETFCHTFWRLFVDNEDGLLMQYTGLKDKNGKEIYEGDIVKAGWLLDGAVVHWDSGEEPWASFVIDVPTQSYPETMGGDLEYEVIGNIYENPEPLENR